MRLSIGSLVGVCGLVAASLVAATPAMAQRVVIASSSGAVPTASTIGVFNLGTGRFEAVVNGQLIGTPVFTSEGRFLLLRRADPPSAPSVLELWDVVTGSRSPVPIAFEPKVAHPRRLAIFGVSGSAAAMLDVTGLRLFPGCGASPVTGLDLSLDGARLVTLCNSGTVAVVDVDTGAVLQSVVAGPTGSVTALAVNRDASRVVVTRAVTSGGSEFALLDATTGATLLSGSFPGAPPPPPFGSAVPGGTLLGTTADRRHIIASRTWSHQPSGGGAVTYASRTALVAFDTLTHVRDLAVPFAPRAVSVSPDDRVAFAVSAEPGAAGRVQLLDVGTGAELAAATIGVPDALGVAHLPLPPTNAMATVVNNTVRLDWGLPAQSPAATSYRLEAGSQPGASDIGVFDLGATPSFPTTAVPNGQYYVRLRTTNATGVSAPATELAFTTPGSPLPSVVSIADGVITEGAAASTAISVSNAAGRTCVVTVTSVNGTAVAPGDYLPFPGATVSLAGVSSVLLPLSAVNDTAFETPETYSLTIALASGSHPQCQIGDGVATVTILSDEVPSLVSIADATVTEGASATTTISMTNPAGRTCQVAVTSANGTAVAPGDYSAFTGGLFSLSGVASGVLGLTIGNDLSVEGPETFTITLALTAGSHPACQLGDNVATITILSDDVASVISIADATFLEAVGTGTTTISMTNHAGRFCAVTVTSANGTAVAPGDYNTVTGTFNISAVPSDVLALGVIDDLFIEGPETFTLTLALAAGTDPRCQLGDNVATITILSDDVASVISIADATFPEAVGTGTTTISMTNHVGRFCAVTVTSANGTAVAPGDYNAVTGTFNMSAVASDVLALGVIDDPFIEGPETFTLTLALAAGTDPRCQLGDNVATITILSNDVASVISIADATVTEAAGGGTTTISMTNHVGRFCAVTVTSANGTAVAPGDYNTVTGTFNISAVPSDVLSLTIVNDLLVEGPETFTLTLALTAGSDPRCQLGDNVATITILSNE